MKVIFESIIKETVRDIWKFERKQRIAGARHVEGKIRKKAGAVKIKGNLEAGVYSKSIGEVTHVGIHKPGYQNFLVELGHFTGKPGSENRKFVPPHPIVYPTFEEEAGEVERIMSEPVPL